LCGITGFTTKNWTAPPERIQEATATLIHRRSRPARCLPIKPIFDGRHAPQNHRSGLRQSTDFDGGRRHRNRFQRRNLQSLGVAGRTGKAGTPLHVALRHGNCSPRIPSMGQGLFSPDARHVCDCRMDKKSKKRIVLARDRMGIKPLYIARIAEDLFFGSELKALFVHPEIDRRLSLHGLECYLALNYIPCPWTLVDGIEKTSAGDWLEWTNGKFSSGSSLALAFWRFLPLTTLESAKRGGEWGKVPLFACQRICGFAGEKKHFF